MIRILLAIALIHLNSFTTKLVAQNLDSLWLSYNNTSLSDSIRLKALHRIAKKYENTKPDTALVLYNQELTFAKKTNQKRQESKVLNNIGNIYADQGNIPKAFESYHESLKIREIEGDKSGIAQSLNNIGILYINQNNIPKALDYFKKSLRMREMIGIKKEIAESLLNLVGIYFDNGNLSTALDYSFKTLKVAEEIDYKEVIALCFNNTGNIYYEKGDKITALKYYEQSLEVAKEIDNKDFISLCFNNIGIIYFDQKNYKKSLEYLNLSLNIAKDIGSVEQQKSTLKSLFDNFKATKKYEQALTSYELYIKMRDSIENGENTKKIMQVGMQYEFDKKEAIAKEEQEKKDAVASEEKKRYLMLLILGCLVLILIVVFAGFMFKRFRITEKQNKIIAQQKHIVEEKHKEITDSISYAERIQRSFMATKDMLDTHLQTTPYKAESLNDKDYFIFFKPKDVVSGDFYWASNFVGSDGTEKFAFVTADSTGHGVPGAIMSLLNITSLEKAIENCKTPAEILNYTRNIIIERLKNDGSSDGGKDGMDCSICVYDFENMKLYVSSANSYVWIVRKTEGMSNLVEIIPDKIPVGKHDKQAEPFSLHEYFIQKGDVIYTLTDGFPDQFGGEKGKKFMSKNLRKLLLDNSHLSMIEQKQMLEMTFKNWLGDFEQVDDVTVVGIRI